MMALPRSVRSFVRGAFTAAVLALTLTAGAVPALASGAGGGGEDGGGGAWLPHYKSYIWKDGGLYDAAGNLQPIQGWDGASADYFIRLMEAQTGHAFSPNGTDSTGESTGAKWTRGTNQALERARARGGTVHARIVGVGYDWLVYPQSGRFGWSHDPANTYQMLLPRQGNASELPSVNGWDSEFQASGKTWRQHVYEQGAADNPGGDYNFVCVAVADTEPESFGTIVVNKTEEDTEVVVDNTHYSLENATFGIYNDKSCTQQVTTIKTDETGRATTKLRVGTYWMNELSAPMGHISSDGVFRLVITAGQEEEVDVENPAQTLSKIDIKKRVRGGSDGTPYGGVSLAGAEVTLTVDTNGNGTPERSFVFRSDAKGDFGITDGSGLVSGHTLYYDSGGNVMWPLGAYTIQETKAPDGLLLEGQTDPNDASYKAPVHTYDMTDELKAANGIKFTFDEPIDWKTPRFEKIDQDRIDVQPGDDIIGPGIGEGDGTLEGCRFQIINSSGHDVLTPEDGVKHNGEVVWEGETGKNGLVDVKLMIGTYTVKEIVSPEGYLVTPVQYKLVLTAKGFTMEPMGELS